MESESGQTMFYDVKVMNCVSYLGSNNFPNSVFFSSYVPSSIFVSNLYPSDTFGQKSITRGV